MSRRLLSNDGIDVWSLFEQWAAFVVGPRKEIVVAVDWTEFDADDHADRMAAVAIARLDARPVTRPSWNRFWNRNKREP